jgi:hypothetical protein
MRYRYGLALLLLLAAGVSRAQEAPEHYLPAGTQVYLRWDGVDAHRAAYQKTALGKMMQGDTGVFVQGVFNQLQDGLGALLTVEQLLRGVPPEQLKKMQDDAREAAKVLNVLGQTGFIFAAEVRSVEPPDGQITLILPGAGAKPDPVFGAIRLAAGLAKVPVKEQKVAGQMVGSIDLAPLHLAWWVAGKHIVVGLGTSPPDAMVKASLANSERLAANPLFKRMQSFDRFETSARAFIDVAAIVKLAQSRGKEVSKLLNDLGVDNLKSLVFYSGFDGTAERGLVEWEMPAPRKGVLALLTGKPFTLNDLPPLPPDVISFSMTNLDLGSFYDTAYKAAEEVIRLTSPDDLPKLKEFVKQANDLFGVDIRKDLIGALGDKFVQYNTPSEGPLNLGQSILFKVRDEAKLQEAIEKAIKGVSNAAGKEVRLKKRNYHGVELREIHVAQQGFFFVPTYAIHKGWLAIAFYPQPVQGFIGRAKGELRTWRPSQRVQESLKAMPQEFISLSYSDPRPSLRMILSVAPLIGSLIESFSPEVNFDVGSVPNPQEATQHLFPNVSVASDDGQMVRLETRASLALPFDVTGLDTIVLASAVVPILRSGF